MSRWVRAIRLSAAFSLLVAAFLLPTVASAKGPAVLILRIQGVIDPNRAKYLAEGIRKAEAEHAPFVILQIDTPGGLLDSMEDMVQTILNSKVPVVSYVDPPGAKAASAGTFIVAAANIAVMAPATNIGAATPVSGSGAELPDTLKDKAINDASARMRGIAQARGRNADPLEQTVREAKSFTAEEALKLNMIDFIAPDYPSLLRQLDGRTVTTSRGAMTLHTTGIDCVSPRTFCTDVCLTILERFIRIIANPVITTLLLVFGAIGIGAELMSPGLIAPGVFGAIFLALAFIGLGNLPVNWVGVGLILLAVVLMVLEFHVAGFGVLGIGAIIAFVLGAFILFAPFAADPPSISMPSIRLSRWFIGGLVGGFLLLVLGTIYISRRPDRKHPAGPHPLIGKTGRVIQALEPEGVVKIDGEEWSAQAPRGTRYPVGQEIQVQGVDGLLLKVVIFPTSGQAATSQKE